nr:arginine--tRNA ligase, chloroplastic/mitochondrial [Tanacetum cinerariifolium]
EAAKLLGYTNEAVLDCALKNLAISLKPTCLQGSSRNGKSVSAFGDHSESSCKFLVAGGDDGHIQMHFVLLWDAVDATIKVKFGMVSNRRVCGEILTYYGYFDYGDDNLVKSFYKASLFESCNGSIREGGDVPLMRSLLDVPFNCYLIIEARLTKFKSKKVIFFAVANFFLIAKLATKGTLRITNTP